MSKRDGRKRGPNPLPECDLSELLEKKAGVMKQDLKSELSLKTADKPTYKLMAAHLPEWPLHPEEVYPEWDGWDKFLGCKICKQCGEREPVQDRLCEVCSKKA